MSSQKKKKTKNILWSVISFFVVILLVIVSFFIYFSLNQKKQESNNFIPPSSSITKTINFETTNQSKARAIQFDVGQADCGLVQVSKDNKFETTNDNFNILVDIGVENGSSNDTKKQLCNKIYSDFVRNVDLIVFSHMHFDHIGAASYFLNDNRFTFKNTTALFNWAELEFTANNSELTATTKTLMKNLENKNIQLANSDYWANLDFPNNKIVDFGNNNYFSVLGGIDVQIKDNPNAWSVINKFNWNNQSILYTGDLAGTSGSTGWKDEEKFIPKDIPKKHYAELDCDILKAPHHGSGTESSNNIALLEKVKPNEVWISAGHSDQYTLPDVAPLNNYIKVGVKPENIKGTDYFGNKNSTDPSKWKSLNEWLKKYPTANNNNNGYGDIKKEW